MALRAMFVNRLAIPAHVDTATDAMIVFVATVETLLDVPGGSAFLKGPLPAPLVPRRAATLLIVLENDHCVVLVAPGSR